MQSDECQTKAPQNICFLSANYPYANDSTYPFVKQLVDAIADNGCACDVIAPQSVSNNILSSRRMRPLHWKYQTSNNHTVNVYQPLFISFSNLRINKSSVSALLFTAAAKKAFKGISSHHIDIIYGHFWSSGMVAASVTRAKPIPLFVASGESAIAVHKKYSQKDIDYLKSRSTGVICVSSKNLEESKALGLIEHSPAIVIPNGVDKTKFFPRDKQEIRKKLSISEDAFIVVFVGAFIERKGIAKLSSAIKMVGSDVHSFFIGKGDIRPDCSGILHCGPLSHDRIPEYLSAADVFVLPTLAEGCSNAIVEAMACGLPIISSDLSFNDDILTTENAIRVDPNNVSAIAAAITELRDNTTLRSRMAMASLKQAQDMGIETRAERIIDFMMTCIDHQKESN